MGRLSWEAALRRCTANPLITHQDGLSGYVVTVLRAQGYRFVIFANDHLPAHVHAFGDGQAKIDISGEAPKLLWAVDMKRADVRHIMAVAREHRVALLERWIAIHG